MPQFDWEQFQRDKDKQRAIAAARPLHEKLEILDRLRVRTEQLKKLRPKPRPEAGDKLIILGYLGVVPNVSIGVKHLDRPVPVTFLLSGTSGHAEQKLTVDVVATEGTRSIASSGEKLLQVDSSDRRFRMAQTLLLTFGYAEEYAVRCMINGEVRFRGVFSVAGDSA